MQGFACMLCFVQSLNVNYIAAIYCLFFKYILAHVVLFSLDRLSKTGRNQGKTMMRSNTSQWERSPLPAVRRDWLEALGPTEPCSMNLSQRSTPPHTSALFECFYVAHSLIASSPIDGHDNKLRPASACRTKASDLIALIDRAAPADGRAGGHPTVMFCITMFVLVLSFQQSAIMGGTKTNYGPFLSFLFFLCVLFLPYFTRLTLKLAWFSNLPKEDGIL